MNSLFRNGSFGVALSIAAMAVLAQTAASTPDTVGVEPAAAKEAIQKAVPRSDTGTVVRTAPSAATRASAAVSSSTNTNNTNTTADSNAAMSQDTSVAANARPMRAARADRN